MLALNKGRSALMRGSCFHVCLLTVARIDGSNPAARVVQQLPSMEYLWICTICSLFVHEPYVYQQKAGDTCSRREAARRCTGKRGEAMALQVWKNWRFVEIYTDPWKNKHMEKLCRLFGIGLIFAILVVEIRWSLAPCSCGHVAQASSACSDPMIGQKEIHACQGTHTHKSNMCAIVILRLSWRRVKALRQHSNRSVVPASNGRSSSVSRCLGSCFHKNRARTSRGPTCRVGFSLVDGGWLKFLFGGVACLASHGVDKSFTSYERVTLPPCSRCALLSQHKVAPRLELGLCRQCISGIHGHGMLLMIYIHMPPDSLDDISPSYLQFQGLIDWVAREVPMGTWCCPCWSNLWTHLQVSVVKQQLAEKAGWHQVP